MRASVQPAFEYRLDPNDVIVSVSDDWLAFARENGAHELDADAVVGKSLWGFIPDAPTRMFYRDVFGTVRATDQPVVVPFRCDSPHLKRFMRLEVRHHDGCGIDLKSILARVEPCERQGLIDAKAQQSNIRITMCSCCKHVLIEPDGWLPLDEANRRSGLYLSNKRPQIRYEVCAACKLLAARQRLSAIDLKLDATGGTIDAGNDREWNNLQIERAELTKMVEGDNKA
jgi:hypothetical protein